MLEKVSRNFSLLLTDNFPLISKLVPEVSSKIKRHYFGDKRVGIETANELIDVSEYYMRIFLKLGLLRFVLFSVIF